MMHTTSSEENHLKVILLAFLVTFLWSTSFIIIKFGLRGLDPLTFAGYRYILASLILLMFGFGKAETRYEFSRLSKKQIIHYSGYGLVFITLTQGTGFVSLKLLPAITVSFGLSLTIILVVLISKLTLHEAPNNKQGLFIIFSLIAVLLFFYPLSLYTGSQLGMAILLISLLTNSFSNIIGRGLNRKNHFSPIVITSVSMLIGSFGLLILAYIIEGFARPNVIEIIIILWLAVVNTALTFTLWNYVLQKLTAFESTIIQNSMLPQITILSIVFLGESISFLQTFAIILILISSIMVQKYTINNRNKS